MPMAKRARGQHLTEKSATVEPSKQAEAGEEDGRPNYKETEKELKNVKEHNSNKTVTGNYNPSRRLALFQLGTDIPLSQFLSGDLAPARSSEVAEQDVLEWVENDKRRAHASCNVRKSDVPEDRYSNAFLGYGPEDSTLELIVFGATSHAKEEKSKKQAGEERGNSGICKHGL
ncbi:hypothetical protein POTOM_026304 [Populus tomentosa]|uniref:Uncharacterized protein n=1 Tax=Populus tomentosa TaxID=118781 RepID=A0A8X8CY55_POPTO|nr:hypothetical protein POTOM_026304 [Populus tomentosa]